VLFIHGLESGPNGRKRRLLEAAGFEVVAGQMPCGRRAVMRDPAVHGALALLVAGVFGATCLFGPIGLLSAFAAWVLVRVVAMRRALARSVDVQLALLARHRVDVVVGSSFGGAVALELLARGAWVGPTVLLCPAHRLVGGRALRPPPMLLPDAPAVVVVHGRQDDIVPIAHSRDLVRGTRSPLVEVDDDHPLSASATPENLAAWIGTAIRGLRAT